MELGSLFVAFDLLLQHASPYGSDTAHLPSYKELLLAVCKTLTEDIPRPINYDSIQRADYHVTKQWMQTLLWQKAMSQGLLSSVSDTELMSFLFPSRIAQSLLASITTVSRDDLLPLGRDQVSIFTPWYICTGSRHYCVFRLTRLVVVQILRDHKHPSRCCPLPPGRLYFTRLRLPAQSNSDVGSRPHISVLARKPRMLSIRTYRFPSRLIPDDVAVSRRR